MLMSVVDTVGNSVFYLWLIAITRALTVIIGAALTAALIKGAYAERGTMRRAQNRAVKALIINAVNIVIFTALVIVDRHPSFPSSLISVGWVVSFIYQFRALHYHERDGSA